jgi:hypothetical protein
MVWYVGLLLQGIAKRILTTALEIAARRNNISYRELRQIPTGHGVIREILVFLLKGLGGLIMMISL